MAIMMHLCMASSRSYGRLVAMMMRPSCLEGVVGGGGESVKEGVVQLNMILPYSETKRSV